MAPTTVFGYLKIETDGSLSFDGQADQYTIAITGRYAEGITPRIEIPASLRFDNNFDINGRHPISVHGTSHIGPATVHIEAKPEYPYTPPLVFEANINPTKYSPIIWGYIDVKTTPSVKKSRN